MAEPTEASINSVSQNSINREFQDDSQTLEIIDEMDARGFRTLAYAYREIKMNHVDEKLFIKTLKNMEPAQIECDLKLLGITAVEDLL